MKMDHVPETVAEARCFLYRAAAHLAQNSGYALDQVKALNPWADFQLLGDRFFGLTGTFVVDYEVNAAVKILTSKIDQVGISLHAGRPVEDLLERIAGGINLRDAKELCHVL